MASVSDRVYHALRAINVPQEEARAVANELGEQESALASLKTELRVLTWMVGTLIVLTIATLTSVGGVYLKLADLALQVGTVAGRLR